MADSLVTCTVAGAVATVTLDDPATRNALGDELLDQLIATLVGVRDDLAARVVVLTSSHERVFSSGGNLKAFAGDVPVIEKYAGLERFPRLFGVLAGLGKPVICAARGDVLAGALGIALSCDLIIAAESARFGCPEINVGAFPFMLSALIQRNLPRMKANELMFGGEPVSAATAERIGFVNAVVPLTEFDATVAAWAGRLAAKSPLLLRLGKNAMSVARDLPQEQALAVMQAQLALAFTTADLLEGVEAFREKRPPVWQLR